MGASPADPGKWRNRHEPDIGARRIRVVSWKDGRQTLEREVWVGAINGMTLVNAVPGVSIYIDPPISASEQDTVAIRFCRYCGEVAGTKTGFSPWCDPRHEGGNRTHDPVQTYIHAPHERER